MAHAPEESPPLLPVIPAYKPWLDRVIKETAADAKVADAGFAARHGPVSGPYGIVAQAAHSPLAQAPEQSRGALADEQA